MATTIPVMTTAKNRVSTTRMTVVWTKPYITANMVEPSSWTQRRMGAMKVYSSVPSQRSTAIVSAIQLNTTDR